MTLDEAIKHCEEVAAEQCNNGCGKDHAQLAEWLKELKRLKEAEAVEMWVARDKNDFYLGALCLFGDKPMRDGNIFDDDTNHMIELAGKVFPEVTFENSPKRLVVEDLR